MNVSGPEKPSMAPGNMERMELTAFYTLLRQDPQIRAHIKSFIEHLDRQHKPEKKEKEDSI